FIRVLFRSRRPGNALDLLGDAAQRIALKLDGEDLLALESGGKLLAFAEVVVGLHGGDAVELGSGQEAVLGFALERQRAGLDQQAVLVALVSDGRSAVDAGGSEAEIIVV